jgi:hypothetical protein
MTENEHLPAEQGGDKVKKNKFEGFDAYDFLSISIPVALILNTVSVILVILDLCGVF